MKDPDVIILGAGAAGLAAAQVLSAKGYSILILEARDRIGGRILTLRDPAFGAPVELGAEFIHGRPEVTWKMVREANLKVFDLPFEHWVRRAGHLAHLEDFEMELGKVMARELAPLLTAPAAPDLTGQDSSTASLVRRYRALRGRAV